MTNIQIVLAGVWLLAIAALMGKTVTSAGFYMCFLTAVGFSIFAIMG